MKKRLMTTLATGALVGAMLVGSTGAAVAGEVNGKGDPTPVQSYRAGSICSFSGQNDQPTGNHDPIEDGRVQSFGDIVQELVKTTGQGAKPFAHAGVIQENISHCRGYASNK